ncbi:M14 family metallopeptidase [Paraburkholderia sp. C35]|uniref:M14 family metallopeptidase n=1 Tax=Paraburkholderia sp. C35 TaxID=2126993 RepID=UPI000D699C44|nr:M14 family metallopeptidase [Paraburkholderia sp. C35]
MSRYHVRITGKDVAALADLVTKHKITVARHTIEKVHDGYRVDAHAGDTQIKALEAAGYQVEQREDADAQGKQRQAETRALAAPHAANALSVATSNTYLDVDQVEAALAAACAAPNDVFTQRVKLPHPTWEKRTCHALKIGKGSGAKRPGIYFLGGVHAREWGSPDILIHFVQLLANAYITHTPITIGSRTFAAADIKNVIESKDLFVFPQANPDGRHYSMTTESMWRKNRRPAPAGHTQPQCCGVDINRNYNFLWNFPQYFDPESPITNSTDPCDYEVYIGPAAESEPETKNAVWMFDTYPNIRYFVDLHSYSEDILYSWGDDEDQSSDPAMNFQNPAYDGKRGMAHDKAYREYITTPDKTTAVHLANTMRDAIKASRGRVYKTEQAMSLYPTAGTSDDYAYSRHIVDAKKAKVFSYTIEWGSPDNPTPFHPAYPEMKQIIDEVTAGLLAFCVAAS